MKTVVNYIIVVVGMTVGLLAVFAAETLWKFRRKEGDLPTKTDLFLYRIIGGVLIGLCCYAAIHYLI